VETIFESIIYFLLAFFPVVLFHEAGHMWVARALGIGVDTYSVGFGKRLFGLQRGNTDYRLSLVPLGGYVRLAGDNIQDPLQSEPHHLLSHPRSHRLLVYLAGPVANLVLALIIFSVVNWIGYEEVYYEPVVGQVVAELPEGQSSPAALAGLEPGDRVVSVQGEPVASWKELTEQVMMHSGGSFSMTVERDGEHRELQLTPYTNPELGYGQIGVAPYIETTIAETGEYARELGFREGQRISAVDGVGVTTLQDFRAELAAAVDNDAETVLLRIREDGEAFNLQIETRVLAEEALFILGGRVREVHPGPFDGLALAASETYGQLESTYRGISLLLTNRLPVKQNLGSILTIAYASGRIAQQGVSAFLRFVATLSVLLAIFNLLPVFPLDGGHLTLLIGEMIRRRPTPPAVQRGFAYLGILLIGGLFILAVYSDVSRLFF
jgi:regulator of sigma E protease